MHFIGKLFSTLLLKVSLSVLIISSTALYLLNSPALIRSSLSEANVYQDVVPAVLETVDNETAKNQSSPSDIQEESPFNDPAVRSVIKSSVDPAVLETQVGGALESFSQWVQHDKQPLRFTLDFQPIKSNLTQNLTDYAVKRAQSLPPCTANDLSSSDGQDIFSLQCQPPQGVSATEVEQKINEQLGDVDFTITEKTFVKDGNPSLDEQLASVKRAYGLLRIAAYGAAVVTLLAGVLFILAHRPLKKALFALGRSFLTSGLLILVPVGVLYFLIPKLIENVTKGQKPLAKLGITFAETYAHKIMFVLVIWGVSLSVLGVILMFVDRKQANGTKKA